MKYAVNHDDHFTNVYAAFTFGMLLTVISLMAEINVMIILVSLKDVLTVVMKYVSLCAIANLPRFYFASLSSEHHMTKVSDIKLKI